MPADLPPPRGPVSDEVITALSGNRRGDVEFAEPLLDTDPLGADVQLALYICFELHYLGFTGVDADWEWDPELIRRRGEMERRFESCLRTHTRGAQNAAGALDALSVAPVDGAGVSGYLHDYGTWSNVRELFAHRSLYHLKEADPHAWVIPRLEGRPKAALVAVEFDEFGGGHPDRMHSTLFAELLRAADMNATNLGYFDYVPPETLATVNFMSMCGLRRRLRGALVGLFAAAEITTAPAAKRMVSTLQRLGAPQECVHFYAEHIEADAVHEQVLRHDVVGELLAREPELGADVVFGIEASELLEQRLTTLLLDHWRRGETSLLTNRTNSLAVL